MPPKPVPTAATLGPDAAQYEEDAVHGVYEAIAPHFSRTRYKPWPLINTFLSSLPRGSLGLDTGAGNGKYLPSIAAAGSTALALDRSQGLLNIAAGMGGVGCVRADICDVPWRAGLFDFAISVAAIHHLSTPERREYAVRALLRSLRMSAAPARFFIYVWAWEQGPESKRKMGSRAGGEVVQDVLVPWVVRPGPGVKLKEGKGGKAPRRETKDDEAEAVGSNPESVSEEPEEPEEDKVYHRYYHLFVEGELRALVEAAARSEGFALGEERERGGRYLRVVSEGWEADNWWIEGEVGIR